MAGAGEWPKQDGDVLYAQDTNELYRRGNGNIISILAFAAKNSDLYMSIGSDDGVDAPYYVIGTFGEEPTVLYSGPSIYASYLYARSPDENYYFEKMYRTTAFPWKVTSGHSSDNHSIVIASEEVFYEDTIAVQGSKQVITVTDSGTYQYAVPSDHLWLVYEIESSLGQSASGVNVYVKTPDSGSSQQVFKHYRTYGPFSDHYLQSKYMINFWLPLPIIAQYILEIQISSGCGATVRYIDIDLSTL